MIPHGLEKLILNGKATFRLINHAFGSYGSIPIPNNSTVIITHVKWHPFLAPLYQVQEFRNSMTWRQFFQFNEYQLKINGKKSINNLVFRNEILFQFFNGESLPDLDSIIDYTMYNQLLILQGKPITTDVYFICEEYIKLTVQRNVYTDSTVSTFNLLNPIANEQPTPQGVSDLPLLIQSRLTAIDGAMFKYVPVGYDNASISTPSAQTMEAYTQPINLSNGGLLDIDILPKNNIYRTTPLIEFGMVVINTSEFNRLKND